jgi:predicted CXXCH cytochrome family protein
LPIASYSVGVAVKKGKPVPSGVAALFLMAAWNPGEISNPHRFFAPHCVTCHQGAFALVQDSRCLICHGAIGNHMAAAPGRDLGPVHGRLEGTRCATCHQEHRGLNSLVIREGALCIDCHRSLAATAPGAGLRNVSDFPVGHPQFRISLVRDAATRSLARAALGIDPKPVDHPNLVFSHSAHLVPAGFPALGYKPMSCADCHVAEPGGEGFLPITYKGQCRSCHALKFDVDLPWKEVPHGDDEGVRSAVADFYAGIALKGNIPELNGPAVRRRLPGAGAAAPNAPASEPRAWAEQKTKDALRIIFDPKRGCYYCHLADPARGKFRIARVLLLPRFLVPARFDHAQHRSVGCSRCHEARRSTASGDVLVPGIEKCVTCHGAEAAATNVQTTCLSCHVFHRRELGPMHPIAARGKQ